MTKEQAEQLDKAVTAETESNDSEQPQDWLAFMNHGASQLNDAGAESEKEQEHNSEEDEQQQEEAPAEENMEEVLRKRLEDTQKWANQQNQKISEILKRAEENDGELTHQDIAELKQLRRETPTGDEYTAFVEGLNATLSEALPMVVKFSGESEDKVREAIRAFGQISLTDPSVVQELQAMPQNEQVAYVVSKGKEVVELNKVFEETGSFAKAMSSMHSKISTAKEEGYKEGYEKGIAEVEERYKDYVSPMTSRKPSIRSSGGQSSGEKAAQPISQKDILGVFGR